MMNLFYHLRIGREAAFAVTVPAMIAPRHIMKNDLSPEQKKLYDAVLKEYEHVRILSLEEKKALLLDIMSRPFIDLSCDWAFKHVFGHNEKNLLLLLNDILPEEITRIEYDANEIDRFKGDDKNVIMDVLCHTEDGRKIIVEMQRQDKRNIYNRMLYYGAAMTHLQLEAGDDYSQLMPVYVICFMNFRLSHDTNKLIYTYKVREDSGELYGNQFTILFCELPRLMKKSRKNMSAVEIWFDLLQNMTNFAERPEEYGARYNPIFESSRQSPIPANEREQYLRTMFSDNIEHILSKEDRLEAFQQGKDVGKAEAEHILSEEDRLEAFQQGKDVGKAEAEHILSEEDRLEAFQQGKAEMESEARIDLARKFKELGVEKSIICQATGLSAEEVEAL